ncbi:sulfatase-like hydrolase/transferase [Taibaiella lutea]|uniref:Sulfatase-like hydrolase/transferase n=1 Tax=Taibaiella lutea TaxID=2608001 RepID=A0A5M6CTW1_9BACT|nr:alkaline phosphatase family protein [Taibaiella lutea]KAA5537412.1 sulfatase-like hydrolase/transferase [Taibaiella lutea]
MKQFAVPKNIKWLLGCGILFLLLMTVLRIVFLNIFPAPSGSQPVPVAEILWLGLRFDARIIAIVSLILFLKGLVPFLNPFETRAGKRFALIVWSVFIIIIGIFYAVDFANYAYLNERLNASLLNYVADAETSASMMWQTYPVIKIIVAIVIALLAFLFIIKLLYRKIKKDNIVLTRQSKGIYGIGYFLLLALLIFGRVGQYPLRWSDAFSMGNDYASNAALNPFQSFASSLEFRQSTYDLKKVKAAYPLMVTYLGITEPDSSNLNFERIVKPDTQLSEARNVVVVICESFSSYKSSMYGNPLNTTPYFDEMCKQGIFFNRCFTPSYGTARGVWTTVTGIPDVDLSRTSSRNPSAVNQHTIMNDFSGYEKYYMIGGSLSWANIRGFLTNSIHDLHIYEQDDYDAAKVDVWGVSDKNLLLAANKIFAKQQKPFIAVVQTADNHRPYTIPDEDKAEFKVQHITADSLHQFGFESEDEYNAFRYTDFCFKKFIEAAKKESYFRNTIFVFVGDHGIGGDAGNMFPQAWTKELTSMHVPLLFYAPEIFQHQEYDFPVSQCDVLPTAAGLAKVAYRNTTLGRDLLSKNIQENKGLQAAFIYNPDKKRIGIVNNDVFYNYDIAGKFPPQIWSILNNKPVNLHDDSKQFYHQLTEAYFQTARYMLLKNKVK